MKQGEATDAGLDTLGRVRQKCVGMKDDDEMRQRETTG